MRAITYSRTGDPDVLTLVDQPIRDPGPGEVRVQVHRSGVNPTDWKARQGSETGQPVDPPQVPGQDGAGIVDAVGPGVDTTRLGQRVWIWEAAYGRPDGTTQEYTIVPAHQAVALPDAASFDLGAILGIPFLTAHRCLTVAEDGPTRLGPGALQGRTVLVAGGAGAVGNAAIQLARWSDATVLTTVSSPEKAQLAAAAGADHIINYRQVDVVDEIKKIVPHGVNLIVEVAPAENVAIDAAVIAPHASIAVYAATAAQAVTLPVRTFMLANARWTFVLVYAAPVRAKEHAVHDVAAAVAAGAISVGPQAGLPVHHFPLEQAAQAHAAVAANAIGKVIVDIV